MEYHAAQHSTAKAAPDSSPFARHGAFKVLSARRNANRRGPRQQCGAAGGWADVSYGAGAIKETIQRTVLVTNLLVTASKCRSLLPSISLLFHSLPTSEAMTSTAHAATATSHPSPASAPGLARRLDASPQLSHLSADAPPGSLRLAAAREPLTLISPPMPRDSLEPVMPSARHRPSSSVVSPSRYSADAFPFSFNRPSRANPSSTSLVPSTAQGKPIPLDDSTAENRTSALREINNHYPSRHRYAKSSGAQNSTYSEPVIVRSYHPPAPARRLAGSIAVGGAAHVPLASCPDARGPGAAVSRVLPFTAKATPAGNGMLGNMVRLGANRAPATQAQQEACLPPVEAFSFKSFMANVEASGGDSDLNADLDRIAEICARSRYSLSNQYEVHYAPHGSGTSFLAAAHPSLDLQGPTLQAVSLDDERNLKRQKRRRQTGRRNSRAMGTLETIMSSSRSSDEERHDKRSAAEIADEIRGRASRKESGQASPTTSSRSASDSAGPDDDAASSKMQSRRPSISLALIDGARQNPDSSDASGPKPSATSLVGEPALPQASTSHLELRTGPDRTSEAPGAPASVKTAPAPPPNGRHQPKARGSIPSNQAAGTGAGRLALLGGWLPWTWPDRQEGRAEGSLRHLLKTADYNKGKTAVKAS
ncbi:hypothetical protein XA68_17662 [Ophiocordyceps unilateralis]|uniref:Uncharacterized protein n=1 Tax=Ophiocordyceps unilateralis TaxID=268505 RepID=A0A2A9PK85_OPHUN|nr:hypothetical protein XA68_17662 [Ophiocordyceps unilateralis]